MTISQAAKFLESAFDVLNTRYFESALPKTIITIQSSPKAYGHYTPSTVWKGPKNAFHEINIGAENLNRPMANTIATLVHEMVHMYCDLKGIQDTSRGGRYHNKLFKAEAEARDLIISYDPTIGHSITAPSKALRSFVARQHWCGKLTIARQGDFGADPKIGKAPTSTRKYECPCCHTSVRATKDVNLLCADCSEHMEKVS